MSSEEQSEEYESLGEAPEVDRRHLLNYQSDSSIDSSEGSDGLARGLQR